jgi:hypothetical protein
MKPRQRLRRWWRRRRLPRLPRLNLLSLAEPPRDTLRLSEHKSDWVRVVDVVNGDTFRCIGVTRHVRSGCFGKRAQYGEFDVTLTNCAAPPMDPPHNASEWDKRVDAALRARTRLVSLLLQHSHNREARVGSKLIRQHLHANASGAVVWLQNDGFDRHGRCIGVVRERPGSVASVNATMLNERYTVSTLRLNPLFTEEEIGAVPTSRVFEQFPRKDPSIVHDVC